MGRIENYRKIWVDAFGPIPEDSAGRSYEIHHIDGNRFNNELSNLKCVSIEEHLNIHFLQGDEGAVHAIKLRLQELSQGWKHSNSTKEKISKAKKGVKRGPYSSSHCKAISEGKKGIKRNEESIRKMVETRKKNGSYKVSDETIRKRLEAKKKNGTTNPNSEASLKKRMETIKKNPYRHTVESIKKAVETRRKNGSYVRSKKIS